MGAQVGGLSRRVAVERDAASECEEHFGRWFQQQRELRGISVWFVAARTKLSPERVRAIETDEAALKADGHGRGTARALARAIGADPGEAMVWLARKPTRSAARARARARVRLFFSPVRMGATLGLGLGLGLGAWLLGSWLSSGESQRDAPPLVYRPDYVERLLNGEGS